MKLVLARHGNNFDAGQKVVWVGAREDLPLVASGIAQAKAVGQSLKNADFKINQIFCSELMRTKDYAKTIVEEAAAGKTPVVRIDLNEIDYGNWGGLTTEEIISKDPRAKEALEKWEKESAWPTISPWGPGADVLAERVKKIANELVTKKTSDSVIVSSNGVLRYFLRLVPGEWERRVSVRDFKMKTGHSGLLEYDNGWKVKGWNLSPQELESVLKS